MNFVDFADNFKRMQQQFLAPPKMGSSSKNLAGISHIPSWTSGMTFTTEGSYEQQLVSAYAGLIFAEFLSIVIS